MAKQSEVIGPRTHESKSWLRKIGRSTYRFRLWDNGTHKRMEVHRSIGGRGRHWEPVHEWIQTKETSR
ncbi:hypothetical protein ACH4F6_37570 [Streptomyces sp. NPDC017936]|uniref:hypothetical protein n=1 Tax=Streptomyces sp. NPDC017936 TaxID=3365016 RepID=UPI00379C9861